MGQGAALWPVMVEVFVTHLGKVALAYTLLHSCSMET